MVDGVGVDAGVEWLYWYFESHIAYIELDRVVVGNCVWTGL